MNILDNVTESQKEAITHVDGPILVIAGAGSGKTRVITRRVGYLVEKGIKPANILSITFTNKAANEMKER
ncbi:MAG: UvrD-helicase domain-containing protein, partial [Deltaproteobacteria bacterium]|nr:UvrD-helicase domain-containing protein [Deltaproteobacteria bacterium]